MECVYFLHVDVVRRMWIYNLDHISHLLGGNVDALLPEQVRDFGKRQATRVVVVELENKRLRLIFRLQRVLICQVDHFGRFLMSFL